MECELCNSPGGKIIWRDGFARVVLVDDPDYPGFCRVILEEHVKEMTDLRQDAQARVMRLVCTVELSLRARLSPDKINLASFGNAVPHLHWHVIPRWKNDRHFPKPVWAAAERAATHSVTAADLASLEADLRERLAA